MPSEPVVMGPALSGRRLGVAADIADALCLPLGPVVAEVGAPDSDGWVPFGRLADRAQLASAHTRVVEDNGVRPKTAVMWLATYLAAAAVAPYIRAHRLHGVLLDVPFTTLRVHLDRRRVVNRVAVPPDAPLRELPAAERVVAIGRSLVDGMRPVVDELHGRCRIAGRALWGAVGDGVGAEIFRMVVADIGDWETLARDLDAICAAADRLMKSRPALTPVTEEGRTVGVPVRAVCCSAHRGDPGRCATCPDLKAPARLERLRAREDVDGGGTVGVFGAGRW